jgi:hypothetical protein
MKNNWISCIIAVFEHPDLLTLGVLLISFSVAIQALEPAVEESVFETSLPTNHPLLINILTISNDEMTQAAINRHLNDTDFTSNFRVNVLAGYPSQQHVLNEASISDIKQAIDIEIPQSSVRVDYIMYDNEGWDKTPLHEQVDPAGSTNRAADIVHAAGYDFAASPSKEFLDDALYRIDWRKIELLIIQTQKLVETSEFKSMTYEVSSAVRSENPNCIIMIQVNPSLNTIEQIINDVTSVRTSIDGVSIIWNGNDTRVLDELLTSLRH